jgi:translation elongation factor EF-G
VRAAPAFNVTHPHYPLEQLASSKSTRFQRGFARMAMHLLPCFKDAVVDASDSGLVIRAASELSLGLPSEVLRQIYAADVHIGAPQVRLLYGDTVEEPVMWVRAAVPRAATEPVLHDLIGRGADIEEVDWLAPAPVIRASAPLRELLGYPAALCALCEGRAELDMWLSHYAPVPPEPETAA